MKPKLFGLDQNAGRHNLALRQSGARVMQGGSWKKQRVIVVIPAGESIPTRVYLSHLGLIFPPNQPVFRIAAVGEEVGAAYTNAFEAILAHPDLKSWEYILTIEHDNMPAQDGLLRLLASMEHNRHLHCIGGLYWTKGEGGVPQIWGDPKDPSINFRPQVPIPGQVIECCGTGMGFNLFRMSMFKDERLRRPWFKTVAGAQGVGTQDLYFWGDARQWGYRCAVDCDVLVGHYDPATDTVW